MNLLAHLYIAQHTHTSAAGQILGDMIKGRLDGRFSPRVEAGIHLHRRIDTFTDQHSVTAQLRQRFAPPLRRYAGILIDIGFDYCLARQWPYYSNTPLPHATRHMLARVSAEWPHNAPTTIQQLAGLDVVLAAYAEPAGLQRALDSVARRLHRASPLPHALPALLAEYEALAAGFDVFFPALCSHARQQARLLQ